MTKTIYVAYLMRYGTMFLVFIRLCGLGNPLASAGGRRAPSPFLALLGYILFNSR